jgi:hypothetical protein
VGRECLAKPHNGRASNRVNGCPHRYCDGAIFSDEWVALPPGWAARSAGALGASMSSGCASIIVSC